MRQIQQQQQVQKITIISNCAHIITSDLMHISNKEITKCIVTSDSAGMLEKEHIQDFLASTEKKGRH